MSRLKKKQETLARRKMRVRRKISGTADRPRLSVARSLRHTRAQLIDDVSGTTLAYATTEEKALIDGLGSAGSVAAATAVGRALAERALAKGISAAVFDRGGRPYHGRIRAVAEGAREAGLQV